MKTILVFVFTMVLGLTVNAQSKENVKVATPKAKTTKTTTKTTATNSTSTTNMAMSNSQERPHVCNNLCANGKHNYQHFEKGHVCGEECKAKAALQKKTKSKK